MPNSLARSTPPPPKSAAAPRPLSRTPNAASAICAIAQLAAQQPDALIVSMHDTTIHVTASLEALLRPGHAQLEPEWTFAMDRMAQDSLAYYVHHVRDNPDTLPYFEQATPALEFDLAKIGSRPARRSATRGLSDLRAIPWVFGWMQSRHGLPGWFGGLRRWTGSWSSLRRRVGLPP